MEFSPQDELFASLSLRFTRGIGDKTMINIKKAFGSIAQAISSPPEAWVELNLCSYQVAKKTLSQIDRRLADQEVVFVKKHGLDIRLWGSPNYPKNLKQCQDAPYILYTRGRCPFSHSDPVISIVGTRRATDYGLQMVSEILGRISYLNPMVVSGLAYGIDVAVHRKCLNLKLPTIAVLGHNFRTLYPSEHLKEAKEMEALGGLISDFPSFSPFHRKGFVQRNRIIAGISDLLIVVESPDKGGSLITADLANGYQREVYAVPGRMEDRTSLGCNRLIMSHKARILASIDEMVSYMRWDAPSGKFENLDQDKNSTNIEKVTPPSFLSENQCSIFNLLSARGKQNIEQIQEALCASMPQLHKDLLEMELRGVLISLPVRSYQLCNFTSS